MYKDDLEAARARITVLEAEMEAERKQRVAAEAATVAVQARLDEAELVARHSIAAPKEKKPRSRLPIFLVVGAVVAFLIVGAMAAFLVTGAPAKNDPAKAKLVVAEEPHPDPPAPKVEAEPPPPTSAKPRSGAFQRITATELMALQRQHRGPLKACYERALKQDRSLSELKIEVEVKIDDAGTVTKVNIRPDRAASDLTTCLERTIRRWQFPARGTQTLIFPIIFRGS